MNLYYQTDPTTGSLLRRFLTPIQKELLAFSFYYSKILRRTYWNNWLGELDRGWYANTSMLADSITSVSVQVAGTTIFPIRADSEWDFVTSVVPSYLIDDSSYTIYFKGLDRITISVYSTGSVSLPPGEVLPGGDIYWSDSSNSWRVIEAGSSSIIPGDTIVTNYTGQISISYPSLSMYSSISSGTVTINSGPAIPLTYMDFWTSLDEIGLIYDLPRIPEEDNVSYWNRLRSINPFIGNATEDGLKQSIGRKLGLTGLGQWNGVDTLTWGASSLITDVWVQNLPQEGYIFEEQMKQIGQTYYTSKRNIDTIQILQAGYVQISTNPTSGSGTFASPYTGNLYATYSYPNFTLTSSGAGIVFLTRTDNTPEDIYGVLWNRGLVINTMNKKEYRQSKLLTGAGLPTPLFLDLAGIIQKKVAVTLGSIKWDNVHWFVPQEVSPAIDYMPAAMDY
jgi:hypothetical protein